MKGSWKMFVAGCALSAVLGIGVSWSPARTAQAGAACVIPELSVDLDGDGRPDRVRWARHGDDVWLDVYMLDGKGEPQLRSTTLLGPARAL